MLMYGIVGFLSNLTAKNSETILKRICPFLQNWELFSQNEHFFLKSRKKMLILRRRFAILEKGTDFFPLFFPVLSFIRKPASVTHLPYNSTRAKLFSYFF